MFCPNCGRALSPGETICRACSAAVYASRYSRDMVMFLCIVGFLGLSGLHRFYVGRWKGGVLFLLTGGIFGIGTIIDLVKICKNTFEDADGLPVRS